MAIVPWGVIVWSDEVPRTLRWAALRRVDVSYVHEMDHATPSTRWSVVTIATDAETLQGRASGQVPLDRVEAHFAHYANEASRPLALDLDGRQPLDDFLEPVIERLVAQARHLLHVGELGAQLELVPASYREARGTLAGRGREGALMVALRSPPVAAADPRPLAALLAAELSARELLPDVLALTTAPGPLLAAVARAAALRLGADPSKVGALEELEAFVDPRELFELRAWLSQAEGAAPRLAA